MRDELGKRREKRGGGRERGEKCGKNGREGKRGKFSARSERGAGRQEDLRGRGLPPCLPPHIGEFVENVNPYKMDVKYDLNVNCNVK